jgi:hypothetical protein
LSPSSSETTKEKRKKAATPKRKSKRLRGSVRSLDNDDDGEEKDEEESKNEMNKNDFATSLMAIAHRYMLTTCNALLSFTKILNDTVLQRYELGGLVELCGETLSKSLTNENVIERLTHSDLYASSLLKVFFISLSDWSYDVTDMININRQVQSCL